MKKKLIAHSALLAANIIYGVNFIAVKSIIPEYMPWQSLALFRGWGALLLLVVVAFFIPLQPIKKEHIVKFIVGGLLGITINQSLLVWGLEYTSSINAAIIMTSNPLFVMIFSALLLGFPITLSKTVGILIGAAGALFLIIQSYIGEASFQASIGDLLMLANAILFALYLVWIQPLVKEYNSFTVLTYTFMFGVMPVLFYGLKPSLAIDYSQIPVHVYMALGFVIIGATFLTYLFKNIGLHAVNPTTVSIYIYVQPIVATIIAYTYEQQEINWQIILSMILIFLGVYLVNRTNSQ